MKPHRTNCGSYYPALCQNQRVAPKHLDKDAFLEVTKIMVNDRLKAKAEGDIVVANSLKITINVGLFGKFNFAYSFLFDTLCTLTITINGQLKILMLIERLAIAGIQNVSANTDGIVCIIKKDQLDEYYRICDEWAKEVNFLFEYTDYVKYFRLDVNNYITVKHKKDGTLDIKRKGGLNQYLCIEDLKKGFNKPIVAKAVEEYFVNCTPVRDTVYGEQNIYKFCITQNIDSSFKPIFRYVVDRKFKVQELQKNVRFYVSNRGGVLLKLKNGKYTSILSKTYVTIFNDYFHVDNIKKYDINYPYYINEANKLINIIESGIKPKKKSDTKKQSNRFVGSLFDQPTMDSIKIPRKEEGYEMAELNEISEYIYDDAPDDSSNKSPRIIDENKYDSIVSDKVFDCVDDYARPSFYGESSEPLSEADRAALENFFNDNPDDDLPF